MYESFIERVSWADYVKQNDGFCDHYQGRNRQVCQRQLRPDYVAVFKRTGKDPNTVKVVKPAITPVPANRDAASAYYTEVTASCRAPSLQPVFVDYKKDIQNGGNQARPAALLHQEHGERAVQPVLRP
ncbi:MAG: hypothetical protein WKG07_42440 [Hymenobacter sp.]